MSIYQHKLPFYIYVKDEYIKVNICTNVIIPPVDFHLIRYMLMVALTVSNSYDPVELLCQFRIVFPEHEAVEVQIIKTEEGEM